MDASELDYHLPPDLIAQTPCARRQDARLLVVDRGRRRWEHAVVSDLPAWLSPGDLLVVNDTRVRPVRLHALRATGGKVQILLLETPTTGPARALVKPRARLKEGERLALEGGGEGAVIFVGVDDDGASHVSPVPGSHWDELLARYGRPPLPPYIRRPFGQDPEMENDIARYQTTFATHDGSVAAPTAGLHFTTPLVTDVAEAGAALARLTLHVGPGTFRPVKADRLEDHHMESEWASIPESTVNAVRAAKAAGGRVIAVGTTVTRALETGSASGELEPFEGPASLFITPPYRFKTVDALMTNFHLPRSTLLALVGAFAGLDLVREVYAEAVAQRYRFYSYGDACLFL